MDAPAARRLPLHDTGDPAVEEARFFPQAIVNVTNRCNLRCTHCFVYRDGNPNEPVDEPTDELLIEQLRALRDRHRIQAMLWMGGEPLVKKALLREGVQLFEKNTITTNGTIALADFSDVTTNLLYVVSLDGPERYNDATRGKGVFARVMKNLSRLPADFPHVVQCQCVVTRKNEGVLREFVEIVRDSPFHHLTFSFHVPAKNDSTGNAWSTLEQRDSAVRRVLALKQEFGDVVRNRTRSLELMLSDNDPRQVTSRCPPREFILPLYLEGSKLVSPFCCYGDDVDCDRCGGWVVFETAALLELAADAAAPL